MQLDISDDALSGYAVFEGSKVKRVVLIDSVAFLSGDDQRGGRNVTLSFEGGSVGGSAKVKRLAIGYAYKFSPVQPLRLINALLLHQACR